MKTLTVQQPWASAIAAADGDPHGKTTENRVWRTHHRGLIAIHAGKVTDPHGLESPRVQELLRRVGWGRAVTLPAGAVIAVAALSDCHYAVRHVCCQPWGEPDCYHFTLEGIVKLPVPVPCRGFVGLFTPPAETVRAIRTQLPAWLVTSWLEAPPVSPA